MADADISSEDGAAIWRAVARGGTDGESLPSPAVDRFSELASPVLTDELLGGGVLPPDTVAQSRLNNRFRLAAQRACLRTILDAGFDVIGIKGFALAHMIYPDPDIRAVGDLDILVRAADRDGLLLHLAELGYSFEPLPRPPWGFISEASYAPFVSADGACNLDVHVHPDCYPAYRSLTTARVFADAQTIVAEDLSFRVARPDHAFLLCATNAAKDKFGPFAARKIADAMRLAARYELDWPGLSGMAEEGGFVTPFRAFLKLLAELGVARNRLPDDTDFKLPSRAREEYRRMRDETLRLYPSQPGLGATLRRELLLSTEPSVGLRNAASRLRGLVVRDTGVPVPPA